MICFPNWSPYIMYSIYQKLLHKLLVEFVPVHNNSLITAFTFNKPIFTFNKPIFTFNKLILNCLIFPKIKF